MKQADRIVLLILAGLAVIAGSGLMFSTYMLYDDEGYVLFSLRNFVEGGGLYDRVFSQYGPFFFLFNQALHCVGHDFSHTAGRLITLAYWFAATFGCAALVWRWTRSTTATACTLAGVFLHLSPLINEPSHPGGLIVLLVALTAWLGSLWVTQPDRLALLAGVTGAALLFTKINVGIFLLTGAGLWWWLHLVLPSQWRGAQLALAFLAALALPIALMHAHWRTAGVETFLIVAAAAGVSLVLAAWKGATPLTRVSNLTRTALGAFGVTAFTLGLTLMQGTSLAGLLEGWLLLPLRFPSAFLAVHVWRPGAAALALVSLGMATMVTVRPTTLSAKGVAWLRLAVATVGGLTWVLESRLNSHAFCLSYGLALAWVFVVPLGSADQSSQPARTWLGLLLVTQALHAFPVAGSQISWGTFLWIPLAVLGAWEAVRFLATPARITTRWSRYAAAVLIAVAMFRCGKAAARGWQFLQDGEALGLRGTAGMQLPERTASALRMLTLNAQANGDLLFTVPGLHSFHLWTELPAPTSFNATHWFTLLSREQQDEIRRQLEAHPRAVIIVERELLKFLASSGIATETPLTAWLRREFAPAFQIDTYDFWVRRGRAIPILNSAELYETRTPGQPRYRITLTLAGRQLSAATLIELRAFTGDTSRLVQSWRTFKTASSRTTPTANEFALARLEVTTDAFPRELNPDELGFVIRDAAGERIAEARLLR